MKSIEVVAAIILDADKILCVQRGENKYDYISKKYEFPGGKIEPGESKIEALKREIFEELKMEIKISEEFMTITHEYPDFKITMYSFLCNCASTWLELSEHIDFKWLDKSELKKFDWAAADIPIVESLLITNKLS
jgi:8-oxo-dGTP diphosphatase